MKNANAKSKKSQKTQSKTDGAKADQSSAKEPAADPSNADSTNKVENVSNGQPETFDGITTPVFCLMQGTANIAVFEAEKALTDLGGDYTQLQLDKMMSGELVLPFKSFLYSSDQDKLKSIVTEKGWQDKAEDLTYVMDEPAELPKVEESGDGGEETITDLIDKSEPVPEEKPTEESLDISDPNQPVYDLFKSDPGFTAALNKKETALIEGLIAGKKLVASLSETGKHLFENIISKYESFNPPPKDEIKVGDDGQEPLDEFRTPEAMALIHAKQDDALIQGEAELPLTEEEKAEYARLNKKFKEAKNAFDSAPFKMMEIASEVRGKKLYREEYASIKDWAEGQGITREYAQQLAQWGDFRTVLAEIGATPLTLAGSVNATQKWAQDTNKIAKLLHIRPSEYDLMKPIIEAVSSVVEEVGTDANGNLNSVAPRIFSAANDKIPEIIQTGLIEIGGEQMKIEDALALGEDVVTEIIKAQMVEVVAEGIKAQKQQFVDYINDSKANRTKTHEPAEPPKTDDKNLFSGVVPSYAVECTGHPEFDDNYIVNVFNAGFELKCGCKYQRLTTSGDSFVCIETSGLMVQH